jgi:hypothetical protein
MSPARAEQARAFLAEHSRVRAAQIMLARSYSAEEMALRMGLKSPDLATRLMRSNRSAARFGANFGAGLAFNDGYSLGAYSASGQDSISSNSANRHMKAGSACPANLLQWLDGSTARNASIQLGLAAALATCKGSLIRSEITALEELHGENAVIFAFAAQALLRNCISMKDVNALTLHDVSKLRHIGDRAMMAWLELHHGKNAQWVAHMFKGAGQSEIPMEKTQSMLTMMQANS